jgi:hypothetical protein
MANTRRFKSTLPEVEYFYTLSTWSSGLPRAPTSETDLARLAPG